MRDLLPDSLHQFIRDRYLAGVADAEATFASSESDEDSLTGALGQSISMPRPLQFTDSGRSYVLKIEYSKVRGRGFGAPEKKFGTDGIFQIELLDEKGNVVRKKGLPFQAKKNWNGSDQKLALQAEDMLREVGKGIIIDYRESGYQACPGDIAIIAQGNRRLVEELKEMRPLGQVLANDFLDCTIGIQGVFYNRKNERFEGADLPPARNLDVIETSIQTNRPPE